MDIAELRRLFAAYLDGTISPEYHERLSAAVHEEGDADWQSALEPLIHETAPDEPFNKQEWEPVIQYILNSQAPVIRMRTNRKIRWIAAAAVLLLLSLATYFIFFNNRQVNVERAIVKQDIPAPASHKATLRLADGRIIILDTVHTGNIAANASKISEGELQYEANTTTVQFHTLSVPKGSRPMQLRLADGTQVWLNVGSSITYPTAFVGKERRVSVVGEAYFEVATKTIPAGNKTPFIVDVDGRAEVEVLGTHFNIKAYNDETTIKTTLLVGSVSVRQSAPDSYRARQSAVLKPGQQAFIDQSTFQLINPDIEEVMAWKNGIFKFNKADIRSIMQQVARWYDVEIRYEGEISGSFGGTIPNDVNISRLLAMLELTDHVRFNINGRTITVKPYSK